MWAISTTQSLTGENTCSKAGKFLTTIQQNYLVQLIDQPTHFRAFQSPTLIDLLFTNDTDFIGDIDVLPPIGKSHHITFVSQFTNKLEIKQLFIPPNISMIKGTTQGWDPL